MERRTPQFFKIDRRRKVQLGPEVTDEPRVDWALVQAKESTHRKRRRVLDYEVADRIAAGRAARSLTPTKGTDRGLR